VRRAFSLLLVIAATLFLPAARADEPRYQQRWLYSMHNLMVDKNADEVVALIQRAGKAGYNGIVLADYKLNKLGEMPPGYFKNAARVQEAATAAGLEVIPCVFPIGRSDGLLGHDPNLAEGLPVVDAPFVVKDGEAVLVPDPAAKLKNGGLEETKGDGNVFVGFGYQDNPGKSTFADREVVHGGKVSCRMEDVAKHSEHHLCRLIQSVKLRPHACYRFSCWVKTKDLKPTGAFRLTAIAKSGRALTFFEQQLDATADWKQYGIVFNTLDNEEVTVYVGQWGGETGTLWVDDLQLEEQGLVNVLRREGCPLKVASEDGKTVYEEGKDFQPVRDPKLGQVPWPGGYVFNQANIPIQLTAKSRIKDGEKLRVSWYHPIEIQDGEIMCCLTDPKVLDILRDQAKRVNDLYKPKTFFLSHDEIRNVGWCKSCQESKLTPGQLLAQNAKKCVEIIKEINPKARIVIWSDMFDPFHNAVDKYYLVNGTLEGSWEGLPKDVTIVNWNNGKAEKSLKWFADRGHSQILAGYYDSDPSEFKTWDTAARKVKNVSGFMYTTWAGKYDQLETYGKLMRGVE
jgi:hypothetical protein